MTALCECGCGAPAGRGYRDKPRRYLNGHNTRGKPLSPEHRRKVSEALILRAPDVVERFWVKVVKTQGCWFWTGARASGYGQFRLPPKSEGIRVQAHVFAYELLHGPVPDGLELDHICRVKRCVNPSHLEAVTHSENIRRAYEAKEASCV